MFCCYKTGLLLDWRHNVRLDETLLVNFLSCRKYTEGWNKPFIVPICLNTDRLITSIGSKFQHGIYSGSVEIVIVYIPPICILV